MDWGSFIGPAVVAAGVSGSISVIGLIVSTRTARAIHTEKLASDRDLAERKFDFDKNMTQRKFDFDNAIVERKFKYDRELHDHKRKTELAEQTLIAFYEARDSLVWVRSRASYGVEGKSRTPALGESEEQQNRRNTYFIPIERLNREKAVFSKIHSLRYAFATRFGEGAIGPFNVIWEAHTQIQSAASILIEITPNKDFAVMFENNAPSLLNTIGWGMEKRPDNIDREIEKAIQDIETLCRPVLAGTVAQ